jgi:molybdopterin molybdotransferase
VLSVEEARRRILEGAEPLPGERVPLRAAAGRVLADDVAARLTQPPFATTAMDGYALRAAEAVPGARLRVIGESVAGSRFGGAIGPGETVRILTGAPLPDGADAVLQQERATREGETILVGEPIAPGRFVRPRGLDFAEGEVALPAGRRLDPRALALAAAMNHPTLTVRRRPKVVLLPTGDELVPVGGRPGPDQIVASSVFSVGALLEEAGAEIVDLGIARDTLEHLSARLDAGIAAGADIVVTLGGASVGDHDLVRDALAAAGVAPGFWRIAMRPGKPLVFGRRGALRFVGLPGNPVSAHVCAFLFLVPLVKAMLGRDPAPRTIRARLAADLAANDGREDYLRATIGEDITSRKIVKPFQKQDSSMQALLAAADGLIRRPPHAAPAQAGAEVEVLPFAL